METFLKLDHLCHCHSFKPLPRKHPQINAFLLKMKIPFLYGQEISREEDAVRAADPTFMVRWWIRILA